MKLIKQLARPAVLASIFMALVVHAKDETSVTHKEPNFEINLPSGFVITKTSPVEDFDIYKITRDKTVYLSIYLGNHPSFPKIDPAQEGDVVMLKTAGVQVVSRYLKDTLQNREMLVTLPTTNGLPEFIHAWTGAELTPGELTAADKILFSLKTTDK